MNHNYDKDIFENEILLKMDELKGTSAGLTWAIINLTTPAIETEIDLKTIQSNTNDLYSSKQHTNNCTRFMRNAMVAPTSSLPREYRMIIIEFVNSKLFN